MPNKRKDLKIVGPNLWYLVGLITSDGCLSSDGRHIDITSKNREFIDKIRKAFGISNKIGTKYNSIKQKAFHIQFANRNFYDFLLSIGLMSNKSLNLEYVKVPEVCFYDFLRGVIDGDGGIQRWVHHTNGREQWNLRVSSGSRKFLAWLQYKIEQNIGVRGRLYSESITQARLKYGKMAAREIIKKCYYAGCLGLDRKITLAKECFDSYRGWNKSKTVYCGIS